jgi:SAM-dependent MidA family methyltransferase
LHLSCTLLHPAAPLSTLILSRIRGAGPITVAEFVDFALYHPDYGYYATAPRRSGRGGDFYTSVDAGPLFGEMIAVQLDEMWRLLRECGAQWMHVVDTGAGDGRLTRDILEAARRSHSDLYQHLRATLVERSAAARERHADVLQAHAEQYAASSGDLPGHVTGVILANELLDALPVHVVVGSESGPREVYVAEREGALIEIAGPLSTPALADYVRDEQVSLRPGVRVEIGLCAIDWITRAAAALDAGFLLLFDYGLTAAELYSDARTAGTLTTYRRHTSGWDSWLTSPGTVDITAHVNLTAIARAADAAGLVPLGATDQMNFLMSLGITERLPHGADAAAMAGRLSAKTLLMPGGLGSTMKVMAFAKHAGRPRLAGFVSSRLT